MKGPLAVIGHAARGARALIMNQDHVIELGKNCVTPRNCSLVLPSDLIAKRLTVIVTTSTIPVDA